MRLQVERKADAAAGESAQAESCEPLRRSFVTSKVRAGDLLEDLSLIHI